MKAIVLSFPYSIDQFGQHFLAHHHDAVLRCLENRSVFIGIDGDDILGRTDPCKVLCST